MTEVMDIKSDSKTSMHYIDYLEENQKPTKSDARGM